MQIPKRKSENNSQGNYDPHITSQRADEMRKELERLIKIARPRASNEVAEHAKLGDFSENAAYQMAKSKLRSINNRILILQDKLNNAIIIKECAPGECVQIGSQVTIETDGQRKIYKILGSQETSPQQGIISHLSPIGTALLGHKINDEVEIEINGQNLKYKIIKIE
ncbi:MAG: GreA/GreB family elongation factor [Candidatus Parcubacteria bacterium]|nr:GreA/GreB family elongation factor [Candidatus Parcubacteria bacterium]